MIQSKGFLAVFIREIRRMRKFKGVITLITLLPLMILLFFVSIFCADTPTSLPVAVVDYDNSSLSRKAERIVDATPAVEVVANPSSVEQAKEMMLRGEIDAVLVFPKDMERDVFRGTGAEIPLFVSGQRILNASLIYKDVFTSISTVSSGIEIQYLMKGGLSQADAYQKMMPIYYEKHQLFNPYTSYSYFLLPGFLIMIVSMFAIISAIFFIGVEMKRGSALEWIETGGGSIVKSVVGKLLPYTILFFVMLMVVYGVMYGYLGQPFIGDKLFMLIASLFFVVGCQAFGVIIISIIGNLGLSTSLGAGFSIMAFSFSGLTFPLEAVYGVIRVLSNVFPYKHFMKIFIDNSMRGTAVGFSILDTLYLACFIILAFVMMVRLKKIALSGKYEEHDLIK